MMTYYYDYLMQIGTFIREGYSKFEKSIEIFPNSKTTELISFIFNDERKLPESNIVRGSIMLCF